MTMPRESEPGQDSNNAAGAGAASRARHRGNVPKLPQTEKCHLCPAKFTRLNHLQRHLLAHANERPHKCEACNAEFTRRDLLTRHHRKCPGSDVPRTKRKSCEACVHGKIKCDLQYPCSACTTRGKTCTFRGDAVAGPSTTALTSIHRDAAVTLQLQDDDMLLGSTSGPSTSFALQLPGHFQAPNVPQVPWDGSFRFPLDNSLRDFSGMLNGSVNPRPPSPDLFPRRFLPSSPGDTLSETELAHFVQLFFDMFSSQLPILHRATWTESGKPLVLVRAIQACGALFVNSRKAVKFVSDTIAYARDVIVQEVAAAGSDPQLQNYLLVAIVLLQSIGLHHENKTCRDMSSIWHGMLVMMIRNTHAVDRLRNWEAPTRMDELNTLDDAWHRWTCYETLKRTLLLAHLLDASHCVLFSGMPSAFQLIEFDINLPCEEALWRAPSAIEWYTSFGTLSPFTSRLAGVPMWQALEALQRSSVSDASANPDVLLLNKFSLYVLIHEVLRRLYSRLHIKYGWNVSNLADSIQCETFLAEFGCALHNWLLMWTRNVSTPPSSPTPMKCDSGADTDLPFVFDAFPYYWLAQVTLWSLRSKNAGWLGKMTQQNRFFVINEWLRRIRAFLRSARVPPDLWQELLIIYERVGDVESRFEMGLSGLVSFFPDLQSTC